MKAKFIFQSRYDIVVELLDDTHPAGDSSSTTSAKSSSANVDIRPADKRDIVYVTTAAPIHTADALVQRVALQSLLFSVFVGVYYG